VTRVVTLSLLLIALAGCPPVVWPVHTREYREIAREPTILYTMSHDWRGMQLHGVPLGASAESLKGKRVVSRNDAGWIELRNGARYLIRDGEVQGLGVWDQRLLTKLQVTSPADIEMKFGKPESVDDLGKEKIYRYRDNHVRVMWNDFERRVTTVNVVQ
jgi:hypothetical protein